MKENFNSMPPVLKFLTAHAIACVFLLIGSVIPHDNFSINNNPVTYHEWWTSGAGVGASIIGIILPFTAWHLLNRTHYARKLYISVIFLVFTVPYLFNNNPSLIIMAIVISGMLIWYLFRNKAAVEYFSSNKAFKRDAEKAPRPLT